MFKKSFIEKLNFSGFAADHTVHILRDDLIHPIVSGNKWRKLKYIVEYLKTDKNKHIVTFGGAYSNHLIATAFVGNLFGIKTSAFLRGDETRAHNHYEKVCIQNGMTLVPVSRADYRNKKKLFYNHFATDNDAFMIGEGGRHPLALKGCAEIVDELDETYDYIILPVGTGTTIEGIVKRVSELKLPTVVIGISTLKNNLELDHILSEYHQKNWKIEHNYHRGKYAKSDPELIQFIQNFSKETQIKIEPVYTGKMMMAIAEMLKAGNIKRGAKILCIHTGGVLEGLEVPG